MWIDPEHLRLYAQRDWSRPETLARKDRAAMSVGERVAMAIALYEAARATRPGWPTDQDRLRDLEHHLRMNRLLDKAAHAFPR